MCKVLYNEFAKTIKGKAIRPIFSKENVKEMQVTYKHLYFPEEDETSEKEISEYFIMHNNGCSHVGWLWKLI